MERKNIRPVYVVCPTSSERCEAGKTLSRLQLCHTYYWVSYEVNPGLILFNSARQSRESACSDYHMTVLIVLLK